MEAPRVVEVPLASLPIDVACFQDLLNELDKTAEKQQAELIDILKEKVKKKDGLP